MPNDNTNLSDLRNTLLSNGYTPLPLDGKACYIPGWTTAEITSEWLEQYRRSARFKNTGIRCGRILGVDIDVDNELASLFEELATDKLGLTPLCRFGQGEKRLLVYYIAEPIKKRRTGKYAYHDGEMLIEILSRGSQFAAYGVHPSGVAYEWADPMPPNAEPLTLDIDELPEVTEAQVDEFVEAAEALLAEYGTPTSQGPTVSGSGSADWCLQPDDVFEVTKPAHGEMSVDQIKREIGGETWECNLTAIRPDSDSEAGRISLTDHGLRVTDFVDMVTYFEAVDLGEDGADALADVLPEPPEGNMFGRDALALLDDLIENWCIVWQDNTVRELARPTEAYKRQAFSDGNKLSVMTGPKSKKLVTNVWLEHAHCKSLRMAELRPDYPDDAILDGRILNTYRRPSHHIEGGSSLHFQHFMTHLVPAKAERDLVLDWIAYKLQNPAARMHALVMVAADVYGTGRGALSQILAKMIGPEYMTKTTLGHLTGRTTQSQYNDYLSQSLLVYVPEAQDGSLYTSKVDWYARRRAYEAVKSVVETGSDRELIVRKGVANVTQRIFASIFVSTNHKDALAIEDNDRRLLVVSNGAALDPEAAERIYTWLRNPANIGAAYAELMLRAVEYDPMGVPPLTPAKQIMLQAARSGIDEAWQLWVENAHGDVCTAQQWRIFARQAQAAHELDFPDSHSVDRILDMQLARHADHIRPDDPRWQISVKGAKVRPYVIRNPDQWVGEGNRENAEIAGEILKNGDPGGGVFQLPPKS